MTQDKPKPSSGAEGPEQLFVGPKGQDMEGEYPVSDEFKWEGWNEYVKCSLERLRRLERLYEIDSCLFDPDWHRKNTVDAACGLRDERRTLLSELRDQT
jgi:hypothetical protein